MPQDLQSWIVKHEGAIGDGERGSDVFFFFQAEDGIRDIGVTGVQTCALPISHSLLDTGPAGPRNPVDTRPPARYFRRRRAGEGVMSAGPLAVLVAGVVVLLGARSEERRVGKEWRSGGA